jgi:cytochrome c oxidase subunit II
MFTMFSKGESSVRALKNLSVSCLIAVAALSLSGRPLYGQGTVHEIHMTAKKYEYAPAEIHVKQGEKVRLLITATDRKHGFEIKELGVKTDLEKGKETPVEFDASKVGTYEFRCSDFCGLGHKGMKGKLIVDPAE